jgi:hypothetical protein
MPEGAVVRDNKVLVMGCGCVAAAASKSSQGRSQGPGTAPCAGDLVRGGVGGGVHDEPKTQVQPPRPRT